MNAKPLRRIVLSLMIVSGVGFVLMLSLAGTARAAQTTISSENDGELDQHINWHNDAKGFPAPQFGWTGESMYVGRLADDYSDPVVGPSKFGMMTFDVSSLAGETINSATLRLIQTIDANFVDETPPLRVNGLAPTTEVYGVNSLTTTNFVGEYDEFVSSWNNYIDDADGVTDDAGLTAYLADGHITLLGSMTNVDNPGGLATGAGGETTFVDVDLTALVQTWVDNPSSNLGLMLLNSASLSQPAPVGPNDILARYATHESTVFDGPQLIITHGLTGLPGDMDGDNDVDGQDFLIIQRDDLSQLPTWQENFGTIVGLTAVGTAVPEPSGLALVACALLAWFGKRAHASL